MTWRIEKQNIYPLEGVEASCENVVEKVLENVDAGEDNRNAQDYAQDGQVGLQYLSEIENTSVNLKFKKTFFFLKKVYIKSC